MRALHQHYTARLDDDRADSDQRRIWIFAFHGVCG
jgi:hypothetical protein